MRRPVLVLVHALVVAIAALAPGAASADPCGMVPPIVQGMQDPIERVGAQRTYVFYRGGIETFAIRPGFRGKVEEFGMLIPFPTPPAIRKVPDKLFGHVAAAVDPPEVRVWVRRYHLRRRSGAIPPPSAAASPKADLAVRERVRVIRKEAVGMYEVAVLEAGSAKALSRWMDQHHYKYPKGMDQPVNDYVKAGWCFVAVKTRVGPKSKVNPRPGMRSAKTALPPGGSFSGHVQGMGFRFKTDGLVVPMRLSAFNKGRLRNVVYVLSSGPKRIKKIPQKYVMRQLPGWKIYRNLTRPLPLRVFGGTFKDLRPYQKQNLKTQRNPVPHNGLAAELFASDLLAARKRRLSHPFEEKEKVLLNIGEELGMRGAQIDRLNAKVLGKARKKAVNRALRYVKQMSLTVVDGDFARDTVSKANLRFAWFRMPRNQNNRGHYNARTMGPDTSGRGGVLYRGSIENMLRQMRQHDWPGANRPERRRASLWRSPLTVGLGLGLAAIGLLSLLGLRRRSRARYVGPLMLLVAASLLFAGARPAHAEDAASLVAQLKNGKKAPAAMKKLVAMGGQAMSKLVDKAFDGTNVEQRGWCIVALTRIGQKDPKSGKNISEELKKLHNNPNHPMLVRTWAAAARVNLAKSADELLAMARSLANRFPAISRPLGKRLGAIFAAGQGDPKKRAEQMLAAVSRMYQLRTVLTPAILAVGPKALLEVMVTGANNQIRRQAAAYLATLGQRDPKAVGAVVVGVYKFHPNASKVPWDGGALFVPSLRWRQTKGAAKGLVAQLMRWYLWAARAGRADLQRQLHNNLRSLGLAAAAGYRSPGWGTASVEVWLRTWGQVVGRRGIEKILREQGVQRQRRWKLLLSQLH